MHCSRTNAELVGVDIDVRLGTLTDALIAGPFDVVLCNPPYLPVGPNAEQEQVSRIVGPAMAWNAGEDARAVLGPLCDWAPELLADCGTILVVQSEFSGIDESVISLTSAGLAAEVVLQQSIPFGPVLTARAAWLERTGRVRWGCREEELAIIRADKR